MPRSSSETSAHRAVNSEAKPEANARVGWLDWLWLLLLAGASSIWCLTASVRLGPTFDEPNYVSNGLEGWRSGSYRLLMRQGTMPLPVDAVTLPLYIWERVRGVPFDIGSDAKSRPVRLNDLDRLLPCARAATLLFWCLLLFLGWALGRRIAGAWGGRLAALLLACEPSLLAHASLATTDLALTACLMGLLLSFSAGRERDWKRRVAIPALWMGLAILSKASGLVFGPLCLLAVELHRRCSEPISAHAQPGHWMGRLRAELVFSKAFRRDGWAILALGLLLAFVYVGTDFRSQPSFVSWSESLREGWWKELMVPAAHHLRIFPNAGEGLVDQVMHNIRGHGVFLLGKSDDRALWYYFPVALTIKMTAPLLLGLLVLLLLRPAALWSLPIVAAGLILLFSLAYRVQIGIRFILPVLAFLAVGVGVAVARVLSSARPGFQRTPAKLGIAAGLVWSVASALIVWPHGLCYTNELWGGTRNGYTKLSGSNFDWGQGLKELDDWRRRRGLSEIDVWYFGSDPAHRKRPFHSIPFHDLPITARQDVAALVNGRYLAASTTLLYGPRMSNAQERTAGILRSMSPMARTMTYLIYEFPGASAGLKSRPDRGGPPSAQPNGETCPERGIESPGTRRELLARCRGDPARPEG